MTILDGKATARTIREELAETVKKRKAAGKKIPHLAAVLVGTDGASQTYVNAKVKDCADVGFGSSLIDLPESTTEEELMAVINNLNADWMFSSAYKVIFSNKS